MENSIYKKWGQYICGSGSDRENMKDFFVVENFTYKTQGQNYCVSQVVIIVMYGNTMY